MELATVTLGTQTDDPLACCLINLWKLDCPQKSGENWAYYTNLQKWDQSKSEQLVSSNYIIIIESIIKDALLSHFIIIISYQRNNMGFFLTGYAVLNSSVH